jgi:hypothetical protein
LKRRALRAAGDANDAPGQSERRTEKEGFAPMWRQSSASARTTTGMRIA